MARECSRTPSPEFLDVPPAPSDEDALWLRRGDVDSKIQLPPQLLRRNKFINFRVCNNWMREQRLIPEPVVDTSNWIPPCARGPNPKTLDLCLVRLIGDPGTSSSSSDDEEECPVTDLPTIESYCRVTAPLVGAPPLLPLTSPETEGVRIGSWTPQLKAAAPLQRTAATAVPPLLPLTPSSWNHGQQSPAMGRVETPWLPQNNQWVPPMQPYEVTIPQNPYASFAYPPQVPYGSPVIPGCDPYRTAAFHEPPQNTYRSTAFHEPPQNTYRTAAFHEPLPPQHTHTPCLLEPPTLLPMPKVADPRSRPPPPPSQPKPVSHLYSFLPEATRPSASSFRPRPKSQASLQECKLKRSQPVKILARPPVQNVAMTRTPAVSTVTSPGDQESLQPSQHQGSMPHCPAAVSQHQGSMPHRPAAVSQHQGSMPNCPAAVSQHQGSMPYHPAAVSQHQGSMPHHPAAVSDKPLKSILKVPPQSRPENQDKFKTSNESGKSKLEISKKSGKNATSESDKSDKLSSKKSSKNKSEISKNLDKSDKSKSTSKNLGKSDKSTSNKSSKNKSKISNESDNSDKSASNKSKKNKSEMSKKTDKSDKSTSSKSTSSKSNKSEMSKKSDKSDKSTSNKSEKTKTAASDKSEDMSASSKSGKSKKASVPVKDKKLRGRSRKDKHRDIKKGKKSLKSGNKKQASKSFGEALLAAGQESVDDDNDSSSSSVPDISLHYSSSDSEGSCHGDDNVAASTSLLKNCGLESSSSACIQSPAPTVQEEPLIEQVLNHEPECIDIPSTPSSPDTVEYVPSLQTSNSHDVMEQEQELTTSCEAQPDQSQDEVYSTPSSPDTVKYVPSPQTSNSHDVMEQVQDLTTSCEAQPDQSQDEVYSIPSSPDTIEYVPSPHASYHDVMEQIQASQAAGVQSQDTPQLYIMDRDFITLELQRLTRAVRGTKTGIKKDLPGNYRPGPKSKTKMKTAGLKRKKDLNDSEDDEFQIVVQGTTWRTLTIRRKSADVEDDTAGSSTQDFNLPVQSVPRKANRRIAEKLQQPETTVKRRKDDVMCFVCHKWYYNSTRKCTWIECLHCKRWLHVKCTDHSDYCNDCIRESHGH